jgi:hypothetical protein
MPAVYPSLSTTVIRTYDCNSFDDNSRWLEIDLSIDCDGRVHVLMQLYSLVMMVVWVAGVPLLYIYVLGSNSLAFTALFAIEQQVEEQDQLGAALRKEVADAMETEADDQKK